MDDQTRRVADLLHEAGEVHHVVYRITDGADDDWASFYAHSPPLALGEQRCPGARLDVTLQARHEHAPRHRGIREWTLVGGPAIVREVHRRAAAVLARVKRPHDFGTDPVRGELSDGRPADALIAHLVDAKL